MPASGPWCAHSRWWHCPDRHGRTLTLCHFLHCSACCEPSDCSGQGRAPGRRTHTGECLVLTRMDHHFRHDAGFLARQHDLRRHKPSPNLRSAFEPCFDASHERGSDFTCRPVRSRRMIRSYSTLRGWKWESQLLAILPTCDGPAPELVRRMLTISSRSADCVDFGLDNLRMR